MAEAPQAVDEKQDQQQQQEQQGAKKQAKEVDFPEVAETGMPGAGGSIDVLLDMTVPVTVVLDKAEITVQRLLQLGPGSVLKLEKPVGAPVDLYLKDTRFATATVVVVDDKFAVKIKEILAATKPGEPPSE